MELLEQVKQRIEDDSAIMAKLVGGVYTRRLLQAGPTVYGATPDAFSENIYGVRPSAVLRNEPRAPVVGTASWFAETQPIAVWLYVPATSDGKSLLRDVAAMLRVSLNGWGYVTEDGLAGVMSWSGTTGYRDAVEYPGTLVDTIRFTGVALTRVPA